ncbi:MAG: DUF1553 domain-containing protein [Planctomycetaceae bacterium]
MISALCHRKMIPAAFLVTALLALADLRVVADEGSEAAVSTKAEQLTWFENQIRPLLHTKCVKCHGENQQKGGLRLDSLEAMLKGGESGPALVPESPKDSLLLDAVRYQSFEMPPDQPLPDHQIAALEKWISDGAAWPVVDGKSVRLSGADFTTEERAFWSLQPLTHPPVPPATLAWGHNAIDRFIAARLAEKGLQPAPKADDGVLLRRLTFGLIGLPPSPEDFREFHDAVTKATNSEGGTSESVVSEAIERLLDDSRYGEHWGRYWLDVVRYAESDGFRADSYRPDAWRYRDYVVNAFNSDKPYDQFVMEQLAGDEIAPERAEALVATGFLRTWLYEYNQRDARTQWQDILDQTTDVTGEAFLGMSVGCARCHDHKFDPILQEDYYRLQSCFATMIPRDDIPAADLADRQRYEAEYEAWTAKAAQLRSEVAKIREPYLQRAAKSAIERFPEDVQAVMAKPANERTPLDQQLADLVDRQIVFDQERMKIKEEDQKRLDELEKQIAEISGHPPARLPLAMTVADTGSEAQLVHVGANRKRKTVEAGGLTILNPAAFDAVPTATSTGLRTSLAKWIASEDNPLTARVIVNRVWQHHFGTGLVDTASDFGSLGGRPTHPELLDWLATEFIRHGWSIKWLHRQILNSATWQMSAFHPDAAAAEQIDGRNELRWRFPIRRQNAEQIRDAMLTVSGELQSEQGTPSVSHDSLRRSIYLKVMRNTPEPLMKSLDGVDGLNSIPKRSTTTTPTQALNLMNGSWVRKRSVAMAKRVLDECEGSNPADVIDSAFVLALGRHASSEEIPVMTDLMQQVLDGRSQPEPPATISLSEATGSAMSFSRNGTQRLQSEKSFPQMTAPFTVVAMIHLKSLYPDATVRTIASQWNNNNSERGWALGVTSEKSAYKPRNLILQVVTDTGYEVVASNLRPELNQTYLVCVSVEATDDGKGRATFRLRRSGDSKTETAEVAIKSVKGLESSFPLAIGGRHQQAQHRWDGALDQIALFPQTVNAETADQLFAATLATSHLMKMNPTAAWDFENVESSARDLSSQQHELTVQQSPKVNPLEEAVADVCHVLLNSNEFVYLD